MVSSQDKFVFNLIFHSIPGQSLNDDIWHTVTLRRRGSTIEASVDEEDSKKGKYALHQSCGKFFWSSEKSFLMLQHYVKLNVCGPVKNVEMKLHS